jgi:hypothetical protein
MRAVLQTRLTRLESLVLPGRCVPLQVVYVGEQEPPTEEARQLIIWVHRPGCEAPGHEGCCAPRGQKGRGCEQD